MKKQLFQVMDVMDFEVNKEHLEHVPCAANYSLSESGAYRKTYLHSSAHQLRGVPVLQVCVKSDTCYHYLGSPVYSFDQVKYEKQRSTIEYDCASHCERCM